MNVEGYGTRDIANGEVAGHAVVIWSDLLGRYALEVDRRIFFTKQEVRTAQMVVARWIARPTALRVNRRFHRQRCRIVRIKIERAVHILKRSTHPRHHHMPSAEFGCAVTRFENPFCHDAYVLASILCASSTVIALL